MAQRASTSYSPLPHQWRENETNKHSGPQPFDPDKERDTKVLIPEQRTVKQVRGGFVDASTQTEVGSYNWKQITFTFTLLIAMCVAPLYLMNDTYYSPVNIVCSFIYYYVLKPFLQIFGDKVVRVMEQLYL